jgi:AAA15 family ATPase/GTPase
MIDEIGESLHLDLIRHYLLLFIRNSGNSQLIFTTHNQLLLCEDFVRRDVVWITEKSPKTAETELIPVASYSLHPNKSLFNSYNIGQLGGKPTLGSTLIDDTED